MFAKRTGHSRIDFGCCFHFVFGKDFSCNLSFFHCSDSSPRAVLTVFFIEPNVVLQTTGDLKLV